MARKELSDFNYDYQAYADYLESAECANDEGYDVFVNAQTGDIYTPTDGDWTKGHGHKNTKTGYDRDKDDKSSIGRDWKNPWLKYQKNFCISEEEFNYITSFVKSNEQDNNSNEKTLIKK